MGAGVPRTLSVAGRRYPVVLPSIRDPRLHLAAVIVSIHVLGQLGLGFRVSVAQILAAILTCAIIEVTWTFAQTRTLVWPASAMLTGSGVALIFRVLGTEQGDPWSWHGWYLFALVAGLSLLTKYVIRYRGSHVFNPSNVGLVAAFLVLGSTRVEPLDFWWSPLNAWMVAAYLIILVGGLLITRRLHLLGMSVAFWVVLAAGIGVLAASGHCMTASWAFAPVCGSRFWWAIALSPEILIFLFFMITDPKTVPVGRVARIAFAASVALLATFLIAPQVTEFGAKVALLGSLVLACAARPLFERVAPASDPDEDRLGRFLARFALEDAGAEGLLAPRRAFVRGAIVGFTGVLAVAGIVAAGAPSRGTATLVAAASVPRVAEIDPSTVPPITVDPDVAALSPRLADPEQTRQIGLNLAEDLETEAMALLTADRDLLWVVDGGDHLREMQRRIDEAAASARTVVAHYRFDSLHVASAIRPEGQGTLRLGVEARGTLEQVTYTDGGTRVGEAASRFALTFVLSQPTGERWLIVDVQPLRDAGDGERAAS